MSTPYFKISVRRRPAGKIARETANAQVSLENGGSDFMIWLPDVLYGPKQATTNTLLADRQTL